MSVELIRRGQSQIYGQVGVGLRGQTWINLADAGDTSPQTVENLGAAKTYLLINSEGANVTIDSVDTPTPIKLTGATSFNFVWTSGKIALYELSTAEAVLDASALGAIYHYINGTKSVEAVRIVSQNADETAQSIAYLPEVGRSLPNGVCDEVDIVAGKRTQKLGGKVLGESDMLQMYTSYSSLDYVILQLPNDYLSTYTSSTIVIAPSFEAENYPVDKDDAGNIGKIRSYSSIAKQVMIGFPKGTTIAQAKTVLIGLPLIYQLATPIITYIDPQPLQIFPNGNRWVEFANKEVAIYNTGIHVANTNLPIKEMIKVDKIGLQNGRWYREPVDLADVTVAPDGLSFTIDGATSGPYEQYEFEYYYDSALSTLPELVIPDEPSLVTIKNRNISL